MTEASRPRVSPPKLHNKLVKFTAENGAEIELEAVYEDSLADGSPVGTVVGFHGSPGSHNDFKYIREKFDEMNIRFIGVNWPGFCHTSEYEGQGHGNVERQNYSNAVLDELAISGKIIFMGHSRGCENALRTAAGRDCHGLVLLNPTGLRLHKGLRPIYRLEVLNSVYNALPRFLANRMMLGIYKAIGFRVTTGEEAINALRSALTLSLEEQIEFIEKTNQKKCKKLVVFGGNDHLVEEEIVFEKLEKHEALKHFDFEEKKISEEEKQSVLDAFSGSEHYGASVFVKKDSHFQNKSQADLVASVCQTMLLSAQE